MAHILDYPKTESELKSILDELYKLTKDAIAKGVKPRFKGLKEIMEAEVTIITAIHNIKANTGAQTPGADNITMNEILQKSFNEVIELVKECFRKYRPDVVRRVHIPKPGKKDRRPLGIPTVVDRIVQECTRIVLDPIMEAQFYKHSYGFRPMRDAQMSIKRLKTVLHRTGYNWVVEGDISKLFDNVSHRTLLKKMWNMGVEDQRVLMIVKQMLKAGILNESIRNELGTPQGGIISPLLANIYLHSMDKWIAREWEDKVTRREYSRADGKFRALKKTNLKPAYFVRYADDWVLVTDSKENAMKWKHRIAKYLDESLGLKLSEEKTLITNASKRSVKFLGFDIKLNPMIKDGKRIMVTNVKPNKEQLQSKMASILVNLRKFRRIPDVDDAIYHLTVINSQIRGIVNYYQISDGIAKEMRKYSSRVLLNGYKFLSRYDVYIVKANQTKNLVRVHAEYSSTLPALKLDDETYVGLTNPGFAKWKDVQSKNQDETPYSRYGRELYSKRTKKRFQLDRADEFFSIWTLKLVLDGMKPPKYNFEYYMNRGYVINRDKFKCRVCKDKLIKGVTEIHHCNNKLPLDQINKVKNLASVCNCCHVLIHDENDYEGILEPPVLKRLLKFRDILNTSI